MTKNIDIIIFVCHILENTILDRGNVLFNATNVASGIISDM